MQPAGRPPLSYPLPPAPVPPRPAYGDRRWQRPRRSRDRLWWLAVAMLAAVVLLGATILAVALGVGLMYAGGNILPGVHSLGVPLGGQSVAQAADNLRAHWQTYGIVLRGGDHTLTVNPAALGIALDAEATAQAAYAQGRAVGGFSGALRALLGHTDVPPVLVVDPLAARAGLDELAPQFDQPPTNADVRLVGGHVEATPPLWGSMLDVGATVANLQQHAAAMLADGILELVMMPVPPAITDASPMVAQASQLLSSSLIIRAYDPITDESLIWTLAPHEWGPWLVAEPDSSNPLGLALRLERGSLESYLAAQSRTLGPDRYLKPDEGITTLQQAIASGQTEAVLRVYHHPRQHTVRPGESLASIAYDYGIPYPWIQKANPGIGEALAVGQVLTIPSPDDLLPLPIVPDKRIVVDISQQRVRVYENGQLIWDWAASTGIASSPTSPGVFQIQSHEPNAYASIWNLWMPHFMGVYRPVPDSDFMNGFHGFPTRGGSQLLWTNNLGTPVTYGCILLSSDNAQTLYQWAEEGVVVEIQR